MPLGKLNVRLESVKVTKLVEADFSTFVVVD